MTCKALGSYPYSFQRNDCTSSSDHDKRGIFQYFSGNAAFLCTFTRQCTVCPGSNCKVTSLADIFLLLILFLHANAAISFINTSHAQSISHFQLLTTPDSKTASSIPSQPTAVHPENPYLVLYYVCVLKVIFRNPFVASVLYEKKEFSASRCYTLKRVAISIKEICTVCLAAVTC